MAGQASKPSHECGLYNTGVSDSFLSWATCALHFSSDGQHISSTCVTTKRQVKKDMFPHVSDPHVSKHLTIQCIMDLCFDLLTTYFGLSFLPVGMMHFTRLSSIVTCHGAEMPVLHYGILRIKTHFKVPTHKILFNLFLIVSHEMM